MLRLLSLTLLLCAPEEGLQQKEEVALEPTLDNLLDSLEKLVTFFSKRYDKLNVDGVYGIRLVQSELQRSLEKGEAGIYTGLQSNPDVQNKIRSILKIADETAERALPEVKARNAEYFKNFLPVIGKPWRAYELEPQKLIKVDEDYLPNLADDIAHSFGFNEQISDECMSALIGTDGSPKCDVATCWEKMTLPGTVHYYTTHQLLWFLLGMKEGCQQQFEEKLPQVGGLDKILQSLCSSIVFQMDALFKDGNVHNSFQDLFLEQGALCGGLGFMDAVNMTWLKAVMRWQNQELGCFRELENMFQMDEDLKVFYELMREKKEEWKSRKLLEDVHMGDYCSAHKSGVGAGFYAVYTRLFLDPQYIKHQLWPALYGEGYDPYLWSRRLKYFAFVILAVCFTLYAVGRRRRYKVFRMLRIMNTKKFDTY